MIHFEFGRLWWIVGIPIFLVFVFIMGNVNKKYVIPSFYEVQELLGGIETSKKRLGYYAIVLLAVFVFFFFFLYCVAFIVQLTLEAELSFVGLFIFAIYILFAMFMKKCLEYVNKKGI